MSDLLERMLAHDWTGVFVNHESVKGSHVTVTAAHHGDNVFYELGIVTHEVTPEQLFAFVPADPPHDCSDPTVEICWILDLSDGLDIVDNREVTAEQATELLGRDVWALLEIGRRNHAAWVEAS